MSQRSSRLLIIFIRNPVHGKVKTRLAKSIGDDKALRVYRELLEHTREVAAVTDSDRQVWYSEDTDEQDEWNQPLFSRHRQRGESLGERMEEAFALGFESGYNEIVIIGSDCPALKTGHLEEAFRELRRFDLVLGPSVDGGYYLLGMNRFYKELFRDMPWSGPELCGRTLDVAQELRLQVYKLETLNDIDTAEDLAAWQKRMR
ncbi:MAG: TIGR04282 family arsenosugar biosynthesis glycosyltransferase [Balneolaceae bacterium]